MSRLLLLALAICVGFTGCASTNDKPAQTIILATTTSTRDSGLLDVLVPAFEKQTGIQVKVIAVGTGQALAMGRRGDADVLLTHAPAAEEKFMDEGHGAERRTIMHNDFVLVGPHSDPAKTKGQSSITQAFKLITSSESVFVSRGDESGTHMKEKAIWNETHVKPQGNWYIQAGGGMGHTLRMASEKRAYTLSDRGTYLALRNGLELTILFEGDALLRNPYAIILINSTKHPHVNEKAARLFADFLSSDPTQNMIAKFGIEKFGQQLFFSISQ